MSDETDGTDGTVDSGDSRTAGSGAESVEPARSETESRESEPGETAPVGMGSDESDPVAAGRDEPEAAVTEPVDSEPLRLEDLSLPQRVFVAAVQNPGRGVFILFLLAFGFSFYIALWMAFPRVAASGTLVVGVASVLIGMLLYLLR